jgi:hypothetical protein
VGHVQPIRAAVPYGGMKQSGYGRENGFAAIEEYTQRKTIWVALGCRRSAPRTALTRTSRPVRVTPPWNSLRSRRRPPASSRWPSTVETAIGRLASLVSCRRTGRRSSPARRDRTPSCLAARVLTFVSVVGATPGLALGALASSPSHHQQASRNDRDDTSRPYVPGRPIPRAEA